MEYEVQQFCWFDTPKLSGQGSGTIWKYKRAIEGHKFVLVGIDFSTELMGTAGICHFQIYDGHTFSHWGSFPNIFDQSTLGMLSASVYQTNAWIPLNNHECKEITMSLRNLRDSDAGRFCAILWFFEIPMSKIEILEYAVKQPRYKYRHGSARTLDRFEE